MKGLRLKWHVLFSSKKKSFSFFWGKKIIFRKKKILNGPGVYEWLRGGEGAHEARFIDESGWSCGRIPEQRARKETVVTATEKQAKKQRHKDNNKYTNKLKLYTDQHTQTHTEMLILWLWRHRWGCITQVAVRLLKALYPRLKHIKSFSMFKYCKMLMSVSQCVPPWITSFYGPLVSVNGHFAGEIDQN